MASKPDLERYIKMCKRCIDDPEFLDGVLEILERREVPRARGFFRRLVKSPDRTVRRRSQEAEE